MGKLQADYQGFAAMVVMVVVVVIALAGTGWVVYQRSHQAARPVRATAARTTAPDPTAQWTPYSSPLGKFSLRYPNSWVQPTGRDLCTPGLFDRTLYLGPDTQSVLTCGSENFGQMSVSSVDGDRRSDYALGTNYKDVISKTVTVSGVTGQRLSGIAAARSEDAIFAPLEGTIEVYYVFYTNGTTYSARYTQTPAGHNPSTDVLKQFDLMLTKTLTFTSAAATAPCSSNELSLSTVPNGVAAGSYYQLAVLTNKGPHSCTVTGYPAVSLLDAKGTMLGKPAQQDPSAFGDIGTPTLTLDPQESAYARIGGFPNGAEDPKVCSTVAKLQVKPPGTTNALLVGDPTTFCGGTFYTSTLVSQQQAGQ